MMISVMRMRRMTSRIYGVRNLRLPLLKKPKLDVSDPFFAKTVLDADGSQHHKMAAGALLNVTSMQNYGLFSP
ncbi:hypothetical protein NDU88_005255 [Pleurodeles waltl]|uniref:Uncharacterized protein n=1 Tax=Pleurodeles waltl TaxID=8319 RepID=A0AAV7SL69_PLEWA|nr:hypothetical protein NDU88_005255 [Pleurodeles waltl]